MDGDIADVHGCAASLMLLEPDFATESSRRCKHNNARQLKQRETYREQKTANSKTPGVRRLRLLPEAKILEVPSVWLVRPRLLHTAAALHAVLVSTPTCHTQPHALHACLSYRCIQIHQLPPSWALYLTVRSHLRRRHSLK